MKCIVEHDRGSWRLRDAMRSRLSWEPKMPRYFFEVHDSKSLVDDEGIYFADSESMEREALHAAGEMIREERIFRIGEPWSMIVRDESQAIVATLELTTRSYQS